MLFYLQYLFLQRVPVTGFMARFWHRPWPMPKGDFQVEELSERNETGALRKPEMRQWLRFGLGAAHYSTSVTLPALKVTFMPE